MEQRMDLHRIAEEEYLKLLFSLHETGGDTQGPLPEGRLSVYHLEATFAKA